MDWVCPSHPSHQALIAGRAHRAGPTRYRPVDPECGRQLADGALAGQRPARRRSRPLRCVIHGMPGLLRFDRHPSQCKVGPLAAGRADQASLAATPKRDRARVAGSMRAGWGSSGRRALVVRSMAGLRRVPRCGVRHTHMIHRRHESTQCVAVRDRMRQMGGRQRHQHSACGVVTYPCALGLRRDCKCLASPWHA
jgi:hypothetical protein